MFIFGQTLEGEGIQRWLNIGGVGCSNLATHCIDGVFKFGHTLEGWGCSIWPCIVGVRMFIFGQTLEWWGCSKLAKH